MYMDARNEYRLDIPGTGMCCSYNKLNIPVSNNVGTCYIYNTFRLNSTHSITYSFTFDHDQTIRKCLSLFFFLFSFCLHLDYKILFHSYRITTSKRTCCFSEHIPLIIISCFHFVPSLGTYYEITLGKHTGNSSVSKGNKSSSRTHTIVRYYVSGGYGWAERRCGSLHFCRSTSCIVKYTGMGSVERITANIFLLIFFFVFVPK